MLKEAKALTVVAKAEERLRAKAEPKSSAADVVDRVPGGNHRS